MAIRTLRFTCLLLIPSAVAQEIRLKEVTPSLNFQYFSGSRNRHDLPEIMGGGVAMIDGDGDGLLDLFFCNGGPIVKDSAISDPPCRYYRNLGGFRFEDQTDRANAPGPSYAMGAAVGDYDNDGRDDLFVSGWRDQRLYRNVGNGRFEDVTIRAGLESKLWSTSAAWADLDSDGDLDLYVATYLIFDPATAPYCAAPDGRRDFCGPEDFTPQPDRLYRNNGDGTFRDVSDVAGIVLKEGRGLGVIIADLIGDSRPDIFVANDGTACLLFENLGGLKFREVGIKAGVAYDGNGQPLAGMGVAAGDLDGDGRTDLVVGNLFGRSTVGFLNRSDGVFLDASTSLGLTAATRSVTGFGLALTDFDFDGHLDLIQANGHVLDRARLGVPYAMRPTLLKNTGKRVESLRNGVARFREGEPPGEPTRFREGEPPGEPTLLSAQREIRTPGNRQNDLGRPFREILGRGLAVGDLDQDGKPDVVISAIDGRPVLLRNETGGTPIVVELLGARVQPFGARLKATIGGRAILRELPGGGSYLSSSDRRIVLGARPERIEVIWPSGKSETWKNPSRERSILIREGTGIAR